MPHTPNKAQKAGSGSVTPQAQLAQKRTATPLRERSLNQVGSPSRPSSPGPSKLRKTSNTAAIMQAAENAASSVRREDLLGNNSFRDFSVASPAMFDSQRTEISDYSQIQSQTNQTQLTQLTQQPQPLVSSREIKHHIEKLQTSAEGRAKLWEWAQQPICLQILTLLSNDLTLLHNNQDQQRKMAELKSGLESSPELTNTIKSTIKNSCFARVTNPTCSQYHDAIPMVKNTLLLRGLVSKSKLTHGKLCDAINHKIQRQFSNQKAALKKRMTGVIGNMAQAPLPNFAQHIFLLKEIDHVTDDHLRRAALLRWSLAQFGSSSKSHWPKVIDKIGQLTNQDDKGTGELDELVLADDKAYAARPGEADEARQIRLQEEEVERCRQALEQVGSDVEGMEGDWMQDRCGTPSDDDHTTDGEGQ
ncbi:hypothetical protein DFS34DRAFT_608496 [Phlyctochytrium arcticum]|nr:hypothetical protein DFS34DRAFT_608496 [Phlyctochytrium arcticum]